MKTILAIASALLSVSYDPTRELYQDYNKAFTQYWKGKTGRTVVIQQSHGGSGAQWRSVIAPVDVEMSHERFRSVGLARDEVVFISPREAGVFHKNGAA